MAESADSHGLVDAEIERGQRIIERTVGNIETVIVGKHELVELVVLTMVASGHVLLEDVPGTGKTTLVSSLAKTIDCGFSRIQFTPDVMPSDVTGFSIFNQKTREFEFRPGAIMSNIILADEINRASAKTQSALLEAMEERQVTVDGKTYALQEPFMVLATQNPVEQHGTYPLPEAQVDRFMVKASIGYPSLDEEIRVYETNKAAKRKLSSAVSARDILYVRDLAERVHCSRYITRYAAEIVAATRTNPMLKLGSSPRGGIALLALCQAYALAHGRGFVTPDDVKLLAPHVLCHRISLSHEAKIKHMSAAEILDAVIASIAVPLSSEQDLLS